MASDGTYVWPVAGPAAGGTAHLRIDARDFAGNVATATSAAGFTIGSGLVDVNAGAPRAFALAPLSPSPATGSCRVTFTVPARARVRLSVHDLQGREVALLAEGDREAGRHSDALETTGLPAGVSFVNLRSSGASFTRRVAVLK